MSEKHFSQGEIVTIGRALDCDCIVDDTRVSRLHLILVAVCGQVSIRDLSSTNGTFVNGKRESRLVLKVGDRLTIGATEIVWSVASETSTVTLSVKKTETDQG